MSFMDDVRSGKISAGGYSSRGPAGYIGGTPYWNQANPPPGGGGGGGSTGSSQQAAANAAAAQREATARQQAESARQDAYLTMAQQQAANEEARLLRQEELRRQQGEVASEWAITFLGEWNKNRESLTGMVNTAFADVDRAWESIQTGRDWLSDLEGHKELVGQEYQSFKEAYAPLEAASIQTSMEALGTQQGLMERIRGLAEADYEGVSGRAKADVGSESERARRAEERRLQGMGISPESGRSRAAMSSSYVDEALSKVLAANRARAIEKERVAGVAMGGLSVIRPEQIAGISSGIRSQGLDYLKEMTNIGQAGIAGATGLAQAGGGLAQTRGNIADIYGSQVVQPMGEAGMTFAGTAMAGSPGSMSQNGGSSSPINTTPNVSVGYTGQPVSGGGTPGINFITGQPVPSGGSSGGGTDSYALAQQKRQAVIEQDKQMYDFYSGGLSGSPTPLTGGSTYL